MDTVIHFLFWGLVEHVLFRIGRLFLRGVSLGRLRFEKPTPAQLFLVAILGFALLLVVIFGAVVLFEHV